MESGLAQPLAAGRRVVSTGLTRVKVHKGWGVTALALAMVAGGAVALALAVSGVAGG